jgi:hypothetical protein
MNMLASPDRSSMELSSWITILLVDDNEEVRSVLARILLARILREGGYPLVEPNDAACGTSS